VLVTIRRRGSAAASSANTGKIGVMRMMEIMVIGIQMLDSGIQMIQWEIGLLILQNLISRIQVISSKHSILLQNFPLI
jgi:hypothetical protein